MTEEWHLHHYRPFVTPLDRIRHVNSNAKKHRTPHSYFVYTYTPKPIQMRLTKFDQSRFLRKRSTEKAQYRVLPAEQIIGTTPGEHIETKPILSPRPTPILTQQTLTQPPSICPSPQQKRDRLLSEHCVRSPTAARH